MSQLVEMFEDVDDIVPLLDLGRTSWTSVLVPYHSVPPFSYREGVKVN